MAKTVGHVRQNSGRAGFYVELRTSAGERRIRRVPMPGGKTWPIRTRETAEAVLDDIRSDVATGLTVEQAIAPYLGATSEMSLSACWQRFVDAKRNQQGRTAQLCANRLKDLASYERRGLLANLADLPVHCITYASLEDWVQRMFDRQPPLAPKTIKNALADIGTCLRWLDKRGELPAGTPELPHVHVPDHQPTIPSPAQLAQILEQIPLLDRGQFLARSSMGLRPREAREAMARDFNFDENLLSVVGKGGRLRVLPASPVVAEWIHVHVTAQARVSGAFLFARSDGRPWSVSSSARTWAAACRAAGLADEDGKPLFRENEGCRHAFGTHAVGVGEKDVFSVSAFMGHSNVETTKRYVKQSARDLAKVVRVK